MKRLSVNELRFKTSHCSPVFLEGQLAQSGLWGANNLQIDHMFISFQSRKNEKRKENGICLHYTPVWKEQKDPKIPSWHVKGRRCFHLESPCGAENTLMQLRYYCFCSLSPIVSVFGDAIASSADYLPLSVIWKCFTISICLLFYFCRSR